MNENIKNIENKASKIIRDLTAQKDYLQLEFEELEDELDELKAENKLLASELEYYQDRCAELENDCIVSNVAWNDTVKQIGGY